MDTRSEWQRGDRGWRILIVEDASVGGSAE
jgi:hypothetical protein